MVEYISYKKKQWPVRISYSVIKRIQAANNGKDIASLLKGGSVAMFETILYYGLLSGCKAEETECPFKEEDMEDILDECFKEFTEIIPKFFPSKESSKVTVTGEEVANGKKESNFQNRIKALKKR